MKLSKILVVGNFGGLDGPKCGQTIKTFKIYDLIVGVNKKARFFDTENLKSNPLLLFNLMFLIFSSKRIIILPASSFLPILCYLFTIIRKDVHYIVIGGWLSDYIKRSNFLIKNAIKNIFHVYVETQKMRMKLLEQNIVSNVLPNFKEFKLLEPNDILKHKSNNPHLFRFVFMSRVEKTKGILEAISALNQVAASNSKLNFELDVFGKLGPDFELEFHNSIRCNSSDNLKINYLGFINQPEIQNELLFYDFFLFPTYYKGEGFPGCLVDALSSGLPVIASDWKYNSEIIIPDHNGFLFCHNNLESLESVIGEAISLTDLEYHNLIANSLDSSVQYHSAKVEQLLKKFNIL